MLNYALNTLQAKMTVLDVDPDRIAFFESIQIRTSAIASVSDRILFWECSRSTRNCQNMQCSEQPENKFTGTGYDNCPYQFPPFSSVSLF